MQFSDFHQAAQKARRGTTLLQLAEVDLGHKGQREFEPAVPPHWLMFHGKSGIACT